MFLLKQEVRILRPWSGVFLLCFITNEILNQSYGWSGTCLGFDFCSPVAYLVHNLKHSHEHEQWTLLRTAAESPRRLPTATGGWFAMKRVVSRGGWVGRPVSITRSIIGRYSLSGQLGFA